MQNKQAYTPEVCHRITWAIIVDMRLFFDDIKFVEDFLKQGDYMHFPASALEGDFMAVKHGIKIQQHNFLLEWGTTVWPPRPLLPRQEWQKWLPLQVRWYLNPARGNSLCPNHFPSPTSGNRQISTTSAILQNCSNDGTSPPNVPGTVLGQQHTHS
jgi:hypothetical protein